MDQYAHGDMAHRCARCGHEVEAIYSVPDSGAFTICACGPRSALQMAPPAFMFAVATSIAMIASLLICLS